jgi:hypothetical protein
MPRTLYFVGGEDFNFSPFGTTSVDTTVGHYRGDFARCGLRAENGDSGWDTGNIGTFTDVWFHARAYMQPKFFSHVTLLSEPVEQRSAIKIVDADGIVRLVVFIPTFTPATNTASGKWFFAKVNSFGVYTILGGVFSATFSANPDLPDDIDIQISGYNIPDGGSVKIWFRNTLAFSISGVTLATDGVSAITGIRFSGMGSPLYDDPRNVWYNVWSEVIVSDEDTRGLDLATLVPVGLGNLDNWTTGTFTDINEVTLNDLTTNTSDTAGQIQQYTVSPPPTGALGVVAVAVSVRAQQGAISGPTQLDLGVRTGGSDYWGSDLPLPISKQHLQTMFDTNPDTGQAWTLAELSDAGFNIGMKSVA